MTGTADSPAADDGFDLDRFVRAQQGVIDEALAELRRGEKRTHWMWFVFPQLAGLGLSPTAQHYAIRSLDEAQAYLRHPLLGARLRECARALLALQGRSAAQILGYPDELKLRSSMTLFAALPQADPLFAAVLERYYGGVADERTLRLLGRDR
ncbi:MAG TPA: DUF1810 domain-containing protein [Thauera sp.]|uniref:DUF1810 domain-containing protein n=1 Tax=Thauera sp. TaxID=1905334 RepID=UPI002BE5BECD|nr:DUF1810 domain-containing protein [Thauera sp.]HRP24884.1 DUF1810 domain-containing protein [Thauera sp.]HRP65514.1 DUF1810 domain-containing protein [Thauera sp.]